MAFLDFIKRNKTKQPERLSSKVAVDFDSLLLDPKEIEKERVAHLEEVKQIATRFLAENKAIKDDHKAAWEHDVAENNIKQLREIIRTTNKQLAKQSILDFVNGTIRQQKKLIDRKVILGRPDILNHIQRFTFMADRMDVLRYSPSYSIAYDLYWITAGTIGERNDVTLGKVLPDVFEKYCPELVFEIRKKLIPYLKERSEYATSMKLLQEVSENFANNSFLVSNILLITITEGVVRKLAVFVYGKQNPSLSPDEVDKYVNGRFLSMEGLINRASWKEDLPMKISEAYTLSKYIDDSSLVKAAKLVDKHMEANEGVRQKLVEIESELRRNQGEQYSEKLKGTIGSIVGQMKEVGNDLLNPSTDVVYVSLRTKLQFLTRRYKEDRNSIMHGQYTNFDKGWRSLVYLSALMNVYEVIVEYDNVYPPDQSGPIP